MKKLSGVIYLVLCSVLCTAQTNLSLEIQHKLNGSEFEMMETGVNSLDQDFQVERLEYYLSAISVTHDGGSITTFDDVYGLIDASEAFNLELGNINANNIESISFYVGVDEENNYGDPTQWPAGHPLAPQFPSMHWGWTAGYRFIAIEGVETAENQIFELHGLGSQNYFQVEVPLDVALTGGEGSILIYANVEEILFNVNLSGGIISHGETGSASRALQNMALTVFESPATLSTTEEVIENSFKVFPNPTAGDFIQVSFAEISNEQTNIEIRDVLGKLVYEQNNVQSNQVLNLPGFNQGIYLISLRLGSTLVSTQKLLIN